MATNKRVNGRRPGGRPTGRPKGKRTKTYLRPPKHIATTSVRLTVTTERRGRQSLPLIKEHTPLRRAQLRDGEGGLIRQQSSMPGVGQGVFAHKRLERDVWLCRFLGEIISNKERLVRQNRQQGLSGYILKGAKTGQFIDGDPAASKKATIASYVNHACEPNCEMISAALNGHRFLVLRTLRRINKGEEVTFRYVHEDVVKAVDEEGVLPCACKKCAKLPEPERARI